MKEKSRCDPPRITIAPVSTPALEYCWDSYTLQPKLLAFVVVCGDWQPYGSGCWVLGSGGRK